MDVFLTRCRISRCQGFGKNKIRKSTVSSWRSQCVRATSACSQASALRTSDQTRRNKILGQGRVFIAELGLESGIFAFRMWLCYRTGKHVPTSDKTESAMVSTFCTTTRLGTWVWEGVMTTLACASPTMTSPSRCCRASRTLTPTLLLPARSTIIERCTRSSKEHSRMSLRTWWKCSAASTTPHQIRTSPSRHAGCRRPF